MTVNVNSLLYRQRIVTKRLRPESRGFRCKVALYLGYLHIKFNDEIKTESIWISSTIFGLTTCCNRPTRAFKIVATIIFIFIGHIPSPAIKQKKMKKVNVFIYFNAVFNLFYWYIAHKTTPLMKINQMSCFSIIFYATIYRVAQLKWGQLTFLMVTFECMSKIQ